MDNARFEKILDELRRQGQAQEDADVQASDRVYQAQIDDRKQETAQAQAEQERAYEKRYDEQAVEKLIRERRLAEEMAALGLSDSGLHTLEKKTGAVHADRANQTLSAEKQALVDELARQMDQQIGLLKNKQQQEAEKIRSRYDEDARKQATSLYEKELAASTAAKKTASATKAEKNTEKDTEKETEKARARARTTLIKDLNNKNNTPEGKKALLNDYLFAYGEWDPQQDALVLDSEDRLMFGELADLMTKDQTVEPAQEEAEEEDWFKPVLKNNALQFKNSVLSEEDFLRRKKRVMVDGEYTTYKTYKQYIVDVRQKWVQQGKLDTYDVSQLIQYYGE